MERLEQRGDDDWDAGAGSELELPVVEVGSGAGRPGCSGCSRSGGSGSTFWPYMIGAVVGLLSGLYLGAQYVKTQAGVPSARTIEKTIAERVAKETEALRKDVEYKEQALNAALEGQKKYKAQLDERGAFYKEREARIDILEEQLKDAQQWAHELSDENAEKFNEINRLRAKLGDFDNQKPEVPADNMLAPEENN